MGKHVTFFLLMLLLSACQPAVPDQPTPIGTVTRPDLVSLINWERSPLTVVFRAEAINNDSAAFSRRNDIADCAVYGDNRLVYTVPNGLGFDVIWQQVSDEAIRVFVDDLVHVYKIYGQRAGLDVLPVDQRPLLTETLLLVVNGEAHRADSFGGWTENFYQRVTERCRAIADSPAILTPANGYISLQEISYNDNIPSVDWDAATGLDLSTMSEERTWFSGEAIQALWQQQRSSGTSTQIRQDDRLYKVAIEVPGVSRYSPPPP